MIKVIIERHIADGLAEHYEKAARSTLQEAMRVPGFISGEAMKNTDNPNHRVVIAVFRTLQDWQRWQSSDSRKLAMEALWPMLEREEKFTLLEH